MKCFIDLIAYNVYKAISSSGFLSKNKVSIKFCVHNTSHIIWNYLSVKNLNSFCLPLKANMIFLNLQCNTESYKLWSSALEKCFCGFWWIKSKLLLVDLIRIENSLYTSFFVLHFLKPLPGLKIYVYAYIWIELSRMNEFFLQCIHPP